MKKEECFMIYQVKNSSVNLIGAIKMKPVGAFCIY